MNKLKQVGKFIAISVAMLSLSGCATIFGDNMRTVTVHSHPQGAGVYVDGMRRGTTPTVITLPSYVYGGKIVQVKKEGFQEQVMMVNTKFQPCGLWNIFFWPGWIVDGATGNMVKIDPASLNLHAELETAKPVDSQQKDK